MTKLKSPFFVLFNLLTADGLHVSHAVNSVNLPMAYM